MRHLEVMTLESDGSGAVDDGPFKYSLKETATVLELKEAFTKEQGYKASSIRMYFRRNHVDEPVDDSDTLEEINFNDGFFVVELPDLSLFDGKIHIRHDKEVDVLTGTLKEFEHYRLTKTRAVLKVPWGNLHIYFCILHFEMNVSYSISVKIGFLWPQNTLAVVEEEKPSTYETFQYIIEENWKLTISRSDRKDIKWEVKRRTSEGGLEPLKGKRRSFSIAKEKSFREMPKDGK